MEAFRRYALMVLETKGNVPRTKGRHDWKLISTLSGVPFGGLISAERDRAGSNKGAAPHGPHNVRDVLATHILKKTGSYEQASYAIRDTPEMVAQHYGRFLPQDKAAIAALVLNQVWIAN